jgi:steroid delta-isomerase-like uncharacterized protein
MANQQNEEIARRGFEMFNTGDTSGADEITSPDAVGHDPALPEETHGADGFRQTVEMYRAAFSDLHLTIEDQFSDGDMVCTRWKSEGTNDGELMGMPPSGKFASVTGISIDRIQDGKIVETWNQWDNAGLMQQLGIGAEAAAAAS